VTVEDPCAIKMGKRNKIVMKNLREKAEELLKMKPAIDFSFQQDTEVLNLIHELEVHQEELILQNEELKLAGDKANFEADRYLKLFEFAPSGYFILSKDGDILGSNQSGRKMLGKENVSINGRRFGLYISDDTKLKFTDFLDKTLKSKIKETCIVTLSRDNKNPLYVCLTGQFSGIDNSYLVNMVDISEIKLTEELKIKVNELTLAKKEIELQHKEKEKHAEELILINKELEQSIHLNADKDLFISVLAHDLRNPFAVLLGYTDLLSENIINLKVNEILKLVSDINKSSHDTYNLLEDLLKWSRVRIGKVPFIIQNLSFTIICRDIVDTLKISAFKKNITINSYSGEEISVLADREMLKAILRNLITNAIKYTNPNGTINIDAKKTNSGILISVSDNGVGIESERLNKLFDITQFHTTPGTEKESGTGLGLLLCKEFVEKLGGKIWVESIFGRGSTFYFIIPDNSEVHVKSISQVSESESQIKNLKVLIADDEPGHRFVLSAYIHDFCREILLAENGVEAVSIYKDHPDIDLILLDFHMPKMNGYEAANQIREINKKVIIIVATADTYSEILEHKSKGGINDFFFKPYDRNFLNQLIKKYFDNSQPISRFSRV
jgi:signal transduction histidine kinase/ActR/RegA family two-component response regulator